MSNTETVAVTVLVLLFGTSHWVLPVHTTSNDRDHISGSWQCQTVLTDKFMFLILSNWVFVQLLIMSAWFCEHPNKKENLFCFRFYSREIVNIFSDLTKTITLAFSWTLFKQGQVFQTAEICRFTSARFDDPDLEGHRYMCQGDE